MSAYPEALRDEVERYLAELRFPSAAPQTAGLEEAMRYSLLAGGKRIRPVLSLATARALGADPAGGGDQRGGGAREDVRGRAVAGLRERHPRGGPARDGPDCGRGMTDDTTADALDPLVERLERAAEQLRSGDLSPDAAASLVEDCAGLAAQAAAELERRARAAATEPLPGQDTLL